MAGAVWLAGADVPRLAKRSFSICLFLESALAVGEVVTGVTTVAVDVLLFDVAGAGTAEVLVQARNGLASLSVIYTLTLFPTASTR